MLEYEYSIKAKSVFPFIDYCEKNGYKLKDKLKENRMVFENKANRKIISRITITKKDGLSVCLFDFKNKKQIKKNFKEAEESLPLNLKGEEEIEIAKSILNVLEFEQSADNLRTRYIYVKDEVKFEIDEYSRPVMNIIGIEGEKQAVDNVYKDVVLKLQDYIMNN